MRKLMFLILLICPVSGCASLSRPPEGVKVGIQTWAKYTKWYRENSTPKTEEAAAVAVELDKLADSILKWAEGK